MLGGVGGLSPLQQTCSCKFLISPPPMPSMPKISSTRAKREPTQQTWAHIVRWNCNFEATGKPPAPRKKPRKYSKEHMFNMSSW